MLRIESRYLGVTSIKVTTFAKSCKLFGVIELSDTVCSKTARLRGIRLIKQCLRVCSYDKFE